MTVKAVKAFVGARKTVRPAAAALALIASAAAIPKPQAGRVG
jgi:hypothetical protein